MIESLSVKWKLFVNVFLKDEKVYKVMFSKEPVEENYKSKTAKMLKNDLTNYFRGYEVDFRCYDVYLEVTPFVRSVLDVVRDIPYGETTTYGEIARALNTSPRAVGVALKLNPTPIVIPCHRVIAKNGLGGFSSGLNIKIELLKLERIRFLFQT